MNEFNKMPVLDDCKDIGKIPISGGRYITITTMGRLDDESGGGVYIDLLDKNGNDIPLVVVSDYLGVGGYGHIKLLAAEDPYHDDDLMQKYAWDKDYIEHGEAEDRWA